MKWLTLATKICIDNLEKNIQGSKLKGVVGGNNLYSKLWGSFKQHTIFLHAF